MMSPSERPRPVGAARVPTALRRWVLPLAPPLLVAAFLRLAGLSGQIVTGDEVHGLRAAINFPLRRIFSFRGLDHCMPLSAFFRLLGELGVELSESVIRAPSVVAGLLTVAVLPVLARRRGGARLAGIYAWLLALSPLLVYYSRIARPYAVAVLCASLAAAAFWRWYRGGGHRWAVAYVVAGGLCLWFHIGMAPFVGAALAYGVADRVALRFRGGDDSAPGRSPGALTAVACGLAGALALIVVPTLSSFRRVLLGGKQGAGNVGSEEILHVLAMQGGSAHAPLLALFWLAALAGLGMLLARRPRFALFGLALVAAQWLAVAGVFRPIGLGREHVLARYVLVTLPVVALWAAHGLEAGWRAVEGRRGRPGARGRRALAALVPAAAILGLALGGPYAADPWLRLGPFAGTVPAVTFLEPPPGLHPERVPRVYRLLARDPGKDPVLEAIATFYSRHFDALIALGRVHRRPVVFAIELPWLADPRLDLRTVVPVEPRSVCESGARFLLVHRDPRYLDGAVSAWAAGAPPPRARRRRAPSPATLALTQGLKQVCGEPLFESPDRWVWDLARPIGRRRGAREGVRQSPADRPEEGTDDPHDPEDPPEDP
jgi:hypothetical protein